MCKQINSWSGIFCQMDGREVLQKFSCASYSNILQELFSYPIFLVWMSSARLKTLFLWGSRGIHLEFKKPMRLKVTL